MDSRETTLQARDPGLMTASVFRPATEPLNPTSSCVKDYPRFDGCQGGTVQKNAILMFMIGLGWKEWRSLAAFAEASGRSLTFESN
jgi:hypothetical protein